METPLEDVANPGAVRGLKEIHVMPRNARSYDASILGRLLVGVVLVGSIGCFGVAASTLRAPTAEADIVSVSAIYGASPATPASAKIRVGVMTERVRGGSAQHIASIDR